MKSLLLVILLTGVSCTYSYGQTTIYGFSNTEVDQSSASADEGTFELQLTTKMEVVYTVEEYEMLRKLIELERRDNEDVSVIYNQYVTVFIPSRTTISSK